MDTQAEMHAVLHRVELTLNEVVGLDVGALVPVPRAALSRVMLEGGVTGGEEISAGRLGQVGGHRAVRISDELPDEVVVDAGLSGVDVTSAMPSSGGGVPTMPDMPGGPAPDALAGLGGEASGAGELPPLGGGGDLPPLGDMGGLPPLGEGDLPPPLGDGELPPLGGGDLPPPGRGGWRPAPPARYHAHGHGRIARTCWLIAPPPAVDLHQGLARQLRANCLWLQEICNDRRGQIPQHS